MTDDNKLAAGVKVKSQARTPRLSPQTQPLLSILGAIPLQIQCRFEDPDHHTVRGRKAPGAVSVEFWAEVSLTPTENVANAHFLGDFTRNIVQLNFAPGDAGKTGVIWCRWQGKRGDTGPWSTAVKMTIPGDVRIHDSWHYTRYSASSAQLRKLSRDSALIGEYAVQCHNTEFRNLLFFL